MKGIHKLDIERSGEYVRLTDTTSSPWYSRQDLQEMLDGRREEMMSLYRTGTCAPDIEVESDVMADILTRMMQKLEEAYDDC